MWKCKLIRSPLQVLNFLNEKKIKPENCKITEDHSCYSVFYYVDSEGLAIDCTNLNIY